MSQHSAGTARRAARIFLVDDHPIVREGLAELLNREKDLAVCGQAASGREAMDMIDGLDPDVAVVDLSLEDVSGLALIRNLKSKRRCMAVLVLSMHEESLYAERALRAGAQGYIMKREAPRKVVGAIRRVLDGGIYLSPELADRLMHKFVGSQGPVHEPEVAKLSDRELEVYTLIGQGLKTSQIASRLNLSVKTIETYREHIKDKLGLKDATELVQNAIKFVHGEKIH
jgi:DNA-binding NarL/FixJ family response regulator